MKRELRKALRDSRTYKQSEDDLISTIEDLYAEEIGGLKNKIKELEGRLPKINYSFIDELHKVYPFYTSVNKDGQRYLARGVGDSTMDELSEKYCKDINNDPVRHNQIIELVKWAITNNEIGYSFGKFIDMRDYERLEMEYLKRKAKTTGYGLKRVEQ